MVRSHPVFLLAGLAFLALASTARGLVFFDDFSDGDRDGWYSTHPDRVITVQDNKLVLPGVTRNTFSGGFLTYFDATTIAVGETLTLSFDVNHKAVSNAPSGFRFALLNSHGSQISADGTASGAVFNGYTGYAAFTSLDATVNNQFIYQRANANDSLWTAGAFQSRGFEGLTYNVPADTFVEMSLSVYRKDATTAVITSTINGISVEVEQTTGAEFTFDTIGLNLTPQTNEERIFSHFEVDVIPEPGSMVLLGLGGLFLIRRHADN